MIKDSFRFLTKNGGEHIISLEAESYPELLSMIAEAEADVLMSGGVFLLSANLRPSSELMNGAPAAPVAEAPAPAPQNGNGNGKGKPEPTYHDPVELELPDGTHIFRVKEVFHDTNREGDKHFLKVVLDDPYEFGNGKYGINCFHPDATFPGWKQWEKGKRYAPPATAGRVIVRDPKPGGRWADVVEFRPA